MVVYYYPEAVVLGYQDGLLAVRLRIDAHGVVVHHVGTVRVKVNPNGIEPSSLENLNYIFEIARCLTGKDAADRIARSRPRHLV